MACWRACDEILTLSSVKWRRPGTGAKSSSSTAATISMPPVTFLLDIMTASGPSISFTSVSAARMSLAKKRLIFIRFSPLLLLAYGRHNADLTVIRHFLIGQHPQTGNGMFHKTRQRGSEHAGSQQNRRLPLQLLVGGGLGQGLLHPLGQARLDTAALGAPRLQRVLQDLFQFRCQ